MKVKTTLGEVISASEIVSLEPVVEHVRSTISTLRDRKKTIYYNAKLQDGRIVEFTTRVGNRLHLHLSAERGHPLT